METLLMEPVRYLTDGEMLKIHKAALRILEKTAPVITKEQEQSIDEVVKEAEMDLIKLS